MTFGNDNMRIFLLHLKKNFFAHHNIALLSDLFESSLFLLRHCKKNIDPALCLAKSLNICVIFSDCMLRYEAAHRKPIPNIKLLNRLFFISKTYKQRQAEIGKKSRKCYATP